MSSTNRVGVRARKEGNFAEAVPDGAVLTQVPFSGAPNLGFNPQTTASELIRSDRQLDDLPLVGAEAGGDLNSELAYDVYDDLLEVAFFNTFQARGRWKNRAASLTQINSVDGTTNESFLVTDIGITLVADDLVRATGFNQSANNGFHVVTSATTTEIQTGSDLVDESSPPVGALLSHVGHRTPDGDVGLTVSGSTATLDSTTEDFTTFGLQAGDWIKLNGFTTSANNGFYRITQAPTATQLVLDNLPSGATTEAAAVGTVVDVFFPRRLVNGVNKQTVTLEETFADHNPVTFQYFRGQGVDGFTITAESQSIVSASYTFLGANGFFSDGNVKASTPDQLAAVDATTGRVANAVDVDVSPNVLNSSSDIGRISQGGAPIAGANFVLEATVEIANNLARRNAVGFLGAVGVRAGEFSVTGNLNTFFDNADLARQVIQNTESSFSLRFNSADDRIVLLDAPRVKFSEGSPDVPGKNDDVTLPLQYQAIRHQTFNYTLAYFAFDGVQ